MTRSLTTGWRMWTLWMSMGMFRPSSASALSSADSSASTSLRHAHGGLSLQATWRHSHGRCRAHVTPHKDRTCTDSKYIPANVPQARKPQQHWKIKAGRQVSETEILRSAETSPIHIRTSHRRSHGMLHALPHAVHCCEAGGSVRCQVSLTPQALILPVAVCCEGEDSLGCSVSIVPEAIMLLVP